MDLLCEDKAIYVLRLVFEEHDMLSNWVTVHTDDWWKKGTTRRDI